MGPSISLLQQADAHRSQAGERPLRDDRLVRRLAGHRRPGERRRRRRQQGEGHRQPADPQDARHQESQRAEGRSDQYTARSVPQMMLLPVPRPEIELVHRLYLGS